MLSQTLSSGLAEYRIGPKIRDLRLKKGMGQVQLGKHTDLSPALLSKIERGQLFPTLPTLLRIAMVFGVGLGYFFGDEASHRPLAITRKRDRLRLPSSPDSSQPAYLFESLDFPATKRSLSAYYAEFPLRKRPSEVHQHPGNELIYVLTGDLELNVEGVEARLTAGDAVSFDSSIPHTYRGCAKGTTAVVVVAPY